MQNFRKITENDFIKFKKIYDYAFGLFQLEKEDSFICIKDEVEKVVFYLPPLFMMFQEDSSGKILIDSFYANDDVVLAITKDDYQINIQDKAITMIHEDGNVYSLHLLGNSDEVDFDVSNNGVVIFAQYDKKRDIRVIFKYEHNIYCGNDSIYSYHIEEPFSISIEQCASKRDKGLFFLGSNKSYYKLDFDIYNNRWQYDLATIQEFGVGAVIGNNTYSLQGKEQFSKFYRVLLNVSDYFTITGFPFTRQYDINELLDKIKLNGLYDNISDYFLNMYNNRKQIVKEAEEVLKWYQKNVLNDKKLAKVI